MSRVDTYDCLGWTLAGILDANRRKCKPPSRHAYTLAPVATAPHPHSGDRRAARARPDAEHPTSHVAITTRHTLFLQAQEFHQAAIDALILVALFSTV